MKIKKICLGLLLFAGTFSPLIAAKITAVKIGSKINVTIDGKFFTSYIFSSDEKYPFFYPVNGPLSGGSVTSMRNGEYPHHSSLFFGCDQVNGGNYWQEGLERGRIISLNASILKEGSDTVVISDECIWSRPGADSPVKDFRIFTITAPSPTTRQIDVQITMEMLMDVTIKKTNHSLFSVRVAADLSVKNGGTMVNAGGESGEKDTFGKNSPWMDYFGKRGDFREGIAILQHPENPWYPSPWFTRDYGFMSPTPMYWPVEGEETNLKKDVRLDLRYRVLVHAGTTNEADIAGQFELFKKSAAKKQLVVQARRRISKDGHISYAPYEPFPTRTVQGLSDFHPPKKLVELSKYGGWTAHKGSATGFFHVERIGDRWWGIDPEGYLYINMAINSISMGKSARNEKAVLDKFGSAENWMKQTVDMLQSNGFNCAGSWSDYLAIIEANKTAERPLAYTINWNFMSSYGRERGGTFQQPGHTGYPNDAIFVFDPQFESFCDRHAKQLLAYRDDPNLFGYFSDNEMPFKFKSLDNFLALPESDTGRRAAEKWLKDQGIERAQITDEHRESFMALVGEKYFSVVSKAIKKYDPNHMYIGARFYADEKHHKKFMTTIGKYLDVVTNNYYNYWTPEPTHMADWTAWTGKPFVITEYYTKGEDSGMPNQSGAGWIVKTQTDRGLFYQNYNLALIESRNCVGWHYFKYQDNDPDAKGVDPSNTDANKGIVNNYYEVWQPLMEKMEELNNRVYNLVEYFDNGVHQDPQSISKP